MTDEPAWSLRRGDWFGIFGARTTVVLPPSEKARAAAIWELVDDGAGFEDVLDALVSAGLRGLPGFVLVGRSDEETRVVLRGAARAHLTVEDPADHSTAVVHLDHATAAAPSTWAERTLAGVAGILIETGGDDQDHPAGPRSGEERLAVARGLVRLSSAELALRPPAAADGSGAAEPRSEPSSEPLSDPPSDPGLPTEAMSLPADPQPDPEPEDIDHDGLTQTGQVDAAAQGRARPGIPGQPPAPPVTGRPVARLLFSTGETVEVDRTVLVGRTPQPARAAVTEGEEPRLVSVPSPHQEISATHLEVRPGSGADHGAAVVTDLGSTNGTLLVQPGLPPEDLRAGVAVQLLPGAVVDLGDGVSIEVVDP